MTFASKWHKCSLQAAYKLWQSKVIAVPACPANQWGIFATGQPMRGSDQQVAGGEFPVSKMDQLYIEEMVRRFDEKQSMYEQGMEVAPLIVNSLKKYMKPVQQWKSTRMDLIEDIDKAVHEFQTCVHWGDPVWF